MAFHQSATHPATDGAGRSSDSGLLVLDEFLSFVDEVDDVVHDVPPPSSSASSYASSTGYPPHGFLSSASAIHSERALSGVGGYTVPEMLHEPIPMALHIDNRGSTAHAAFYQSMPPAVEDREDESLGSQSPDSTSQASWDATASSSAQDPPVREKKKRRRRQKEELDYLRVHVKEMEEELARLRGEDIASSAIAVGTAKILHLLPPTTIDQLASGDESDDSSGMSNSDVLMSRDHRVAVKQQHLWERVATHQREETQKAVMENIRLRALLEGQLQVARSLETALRKKPRFAAAELNPYIGKGSTIHIDGDDEQKIYDSIGLQLDLLHAQVDAVLHSSGITNIRTDSTFKVEVRADETGMFLEHKEVRIVPFDVHAVGRAVWKTLGRDSMPLRNGVYIAREATDDTVCAKVVDTFRLPKAKSETVVTIRLVLKRFIEEDRVVSVWESVVETVGPVCLRLREKAWNVLRAHHVDGQVDANGNPKRLCLAHSIIRCWPEMPSSDMGGNTEVGTLTNLLVGSYTRNLGIMAQIIVNLLGEESQNNRAEVGESS